MYETQNYTKDTHIPIALFALNRCLRCSITTNPSIHPIVCFWNNNENINLLSIGFSFKLNCFTIPIIYIFRLNGYWLWCRCRRCWNSCSWWKFYYFYIYLLTTTPDLTSYEMKLLDCVNTAVEAKSIVGTYIILE